MESEENGVEHELHPELVKIEEKEEAPKREAKAIHQGYKITFDSRLEAEGFIKNFWTQNFPQTMRYFENGMWNPAIHEQFTHSGERTTLFLGNGGAMGEAGQCTVILAGNGQMLKPESVDWLVNEGYLTTV